VTVPRVVIAAPQGRSGKTTVCVGLCAALTGRKLVTQPFKKGPDYIDPSWLTAAAGRPCRNLDLFMMSRQAVLSSFHRSSAGADVAVIEGAHGLYDGLDLAGSGSTAQLARLLGTPVILVVNATRMTRSVAALVSGYQRFEPEIDIAGVILNNVAGGRHESMLVHAIKQYCQIPVLGCLPKVTRVTIAERHLGLVPEGEAAALVEKVARARELAESYVDIDAVLRVAQGATALTPPVEYATPPARASVRLGVIRDQAFSFYYPENLEALEQAGAELVYVNALEDSQLPAVSGLYIGGGFPELFAGRLHANSQLRGEIAAAVDQGLPVYAECAGLLYLARTLRWEGRMFEMVGALPIDVSFTARPQGHGYIASDVVGENPFLEVGQRLRGHEFHYAKVENADNLTMAYCLQRGQGMGRKRDGIVHKNVLAGFTHLHALSEPRWAEGVVNPTRSRETERKATAPAAHRYGDALQP
jgi:cobyrinic acid a,c-diamide synthase